MPPARLARALRAARHSAAQRACPLALALDLAGPEFRTGSVYHGPQVLLEPGAEVRLAEELRCDCGDGTGDARRPALVRLVCRGDRILIDDGSISLIVIEVGYNYVLCRVEMGGVLGPGRPISLPDATMAAVAEVEGEDGSLSEVDRAALQVAVQLGVHIVFVSRARCASDVQEVRKALLPARPTHIFVFAKIEDRQGVEAAADLIEVSDGVVVCRGRIGQSLAAGAALVAQKAVVARCRAAGVPVLVALRPSDAPEVAEAADVANAVLDGADGLLLTDGVTYERVVEISDACREAEAARWERLEANEILSLQPPPTSAPAALAIGAWEMARLTQACAQVVVAASGRSARMASRCRPHWPVVVVTRSASTAARCLCWFALLPLHYRYPKQATWPQEVEARVSAAVRLLRNREIAKPEDRVVLQYPSHAGSSYCDAIAVFGVSEPWTFHERSRSAVLHLGSLTICVGDAATDMLVPDGLPSDGPELVAPDFCLSLIQKIHWISEDMVGNKFLDF
ncbi:pyruvate kinase PKLR-like [Schistocerca piceifrons]|uniref:pyruvate kinase PKLR-like n=1 Tax=Schistocerca piceifrons TaxID=274613 RepID=UPI001F5E4594|nr:pyruvate kinase PKLR-like [Schistocerca piceifrons]